MKDKRNILLLNSTLHIGGAEEVIAHLAANLDPDRFRVIVCYLKEGGLVAERMKQNGINFVCIPSVKSGSTNYFTFIELVRLIRNLKIDLVHSHDLHAFIDASVCRLLIPGLCHVHTFHFGNYPNRRTRYKWFEKILWRIPDRLVAVGQNQKVAIQDTYGIPASRLSRIYNGVSRRKATLDTEIRKVIPAEDTLVIGTICTLIPQKGLFYLLEAVRILAEARENFVVLVAGDGPLRTSLQQRARDLAIESRIYFIGWVPEAAATALPWFDVFVQSSLWEAMSIVVLEAMAHGKPLVVTKVGENAKIIDNGLNGILVPPGDAEALAEGMGCLLDDMKLRRRLGTEARGVYESRFTAGQMTKNHEKLFENLLEYRKKGFGLKTDNLDSME